VRIAVVGAGIAGLAAAYLLSRAHEVTVFEKEPRLGGHAHTHDVAGAGRTWPVDTGFMVFNLRTYPHFAKLLARLGVESRESDMSFGVRCRRCGLEYSSAGLRGLFAQPARLVDREHLSMLRDVLRFFARGRQALDDGTASERSLGEFLQAGGHTDALARHFLLPMGGAIWSASAKDMRDFPAASFLRFYENHGLLAATGQPAWRTVVGGSRAYVEAIQRALPGRTRVAAPVSRILRDAAGVEVQVHGHEPLRFDRVVIAAHADEALAMLGDPSPAERAALGRFRYSTNATVLHSDATVLPARPAARASWNCDLGDCRDEQAPVSVTYDLNRLQGHAPGMPLLCTLNGVGAIDGSRVLARMDYAHPIMDGAAFAGQPEVAALNGRQHTFYCGAHLRYGFHEDGLVSALAVTRAFGITL
jgi:predicted NAD/FAD-binding protein